MVKKGIVTTLSIAVIALLAGLTFNLVRVPLHTFESTEPSCVNNVDYFIHRSLLRLCQGLLFKVWSTIFIHILAVSLVC